MCLLHCRQRPVKKDALPKIQMSLVIVKKHRAELATAPPEKRLESPKISVDPPSVDAPRLGPPVTNAIVLGSESGSRLMTI